MLGGGASAAKTPRTTAEPTTTKPMPRAPIDIASARIRGVIVAAPAARATSRAGTSRRPRGRGRGDRQSPGLPYDSDPTRERHERHGRMSPLRPSRRLFLRRLASSASGSHFDGGGAPERFPWRPTTPGSGVKRRHRQRRHGRVGIIAPTFTRRACSRSRQAQRQTGATLIRPPRPRACRAARAPRRRADAPSPR